MDNQEYLRQISAASSQPSSQSGGSSFNLSKIVSSLYFKLGVGTVVAFIAMAIFGAVLGGGGDSLKNNCFSLKFHIDFLSNSIDNYQKLVKSSELRSDSASFDTVLSNVNRDLTNYLVSKYGYKESDTKNKNKIYDNKILEEQQLQFNEREQYLFNAKINGVLDRYYAHQMAYEISYLTAKESALAKSIKDETLKTTLNSSLSSLENLYTKFDDFSEAKK